MISRRSLFTIAPTSPFLPMLAARVLDGTLLGNWPRGKQNPFWLSDVTIILPTRRARLALAAEFAHRLGGAALLPDIRTFGGEHAEEELFLPPFDLAPQPQATTALERRLALSGLVRAFAARSGSFATPPSASEVFWLAESLGGLIDDLTIEKVPVSALRQLVPEELAGNWQQILDFLDIVLEAWPQALAERGRVDAAAARNARLALQAEAAPLLYGERPVIAAGSTGSIPATARLLEAIVGLPRGVLVLPGLDTGMTPPQHEAMLAGEAMESHPQYGLMKLLRRLGAGVAGVEELAPAHPRDALLRAALAPSHETPHWPELRAGLALDEALAGVAVLAAPNADSEARAIALAARDGLVRGLSVGIVSRDQTLARRIAVELKRHGIDVDDAAGTPLYQSAAGRLARQALAVVGSAYAPIDVVALLRNAAVTVGIEAPLRHRLIDRLDMALRGKQVAPGLAGLREHAEGEELHGLLDRLEAALAPLWDITRRVEMKAVDLAAALVASLASLAPEADLPGLAELMSWADELTALGPTGTGFPPRLLDRVLGALLTGITVPTPPGRAREDIAIWGELEARLQAPGLMILAGVNEDVWPPVADPGPWLSRGMRIAIGLEPPERRQGQAAHDFVMALGNAEVLVAYAARIGTSPALPSPLLQRLDAFVGKPVAAQLRERGGRWLREAEMLDLAGPARPARRPMPSPPAKHRPRKLSVTEIETLIRSPYDIYARHVLGLRRIEPLGADPGARDRGTMIHGVFERFVLEGHAFDTPAAQDRLMALAAEAFTGPDAQEERRAIWLRRFERAATQFLAHERARDGDIAARLPERRGQHTFPLLDGFTLVGKADRIDRRHDGRVEIIDFKTGTLPSSSDMSGFDAPQLLLEAAMIRAGGFAGLPAAKAGQLTYIKIGLGPDAFRPVPFRLARGMTLDEAVDEIDRRLQAHVEAFLIRDSLPMAAHIRPRADAARSGFRGDYDHLARLDEWMLLSGGDE